MVLKSVALNLLFNLVVGKGDVFRLNTSVPYALFRIIELKVYNACNDNSVVSFYFHLK